MFLTVKQVRELLREGKDKYMITMNGTGRHIKTYVIEKVSHNIVGQIQRSTLNGIDTEFKNTSTIRYYDFV